MLRQDLLDIINNGYAPSIGELRPSRDNVHHYYKLLVDAITKAKPTGPTPEYIRELEVAAVAAKKDRDALVATIAEIAGRVDTSRIAIHNDEECYLLDWQDYVALRKIAAAKEGE